MFGSRKAECEPSAVNAGREPLGEDDSTPLDFEAQARSSLKGVNNLVANITPWLIEIGDWVFGGLGAFGLVMLATLITVGPVDPVVLFATATFAVALPLNLVGIVLLRLIKGTKDLSIDELAFKAFQAANFPNIEAYFPSLQERASLEKRRSRVTLIYCWSILVLSTFLTLAGLVAALWHMAWWTAVALIVATILGVLLVAVAIANAMPPVSQAEKALRARRSRQRSERTER